MLSAHPIDPVLIPDTHPSPSRPTPDPIDVSASPRQSDDDCSPPRSQILRKNPLPQFFQSRSRYLSSTSTLLLIVLILFPLAFQGSLNSSL
jgi:hypothetical protein